MSSNRTQRIAASAVAAVGIALGAAGISAAATSSAAPTRPAVHKSVPAEADAGKPDTDKVQSGDQTSPDPPAVLRTRTTGTAAKSAAELKAKDSTDAEATGGVDTDNVQQQDGPGDVQHGDQTTPEIRAGWGQ